MAMTNAEKQAAWRARQANELARLQAENETLRSQLGYQPSARESDSGVVGADVAYALGYLTPQELVAILCAECAVDELVHIVSLLLHFLMTESDFKLTTDFLVSLDRRAAQAVNPTA